MKYQVGVKIFNSFEVEGDSEEEAEEKAWPENALSSSYSTLRGTAQGAASRQAPAAHSGSSNVQLQYGLAM